MNDEEFFGRAMGGEGRAPIGHQRELAGGDTGRFGTSHLIDIPKGLGKTYGNGRASRTA